MREVDERRKHLEWFRQQGINPYAYGFEQKQHAAEIASAFSKFDNKKAKVAGRLMAIRGHGKASFADLVDSSGKIQLFIALDEIGEKSLEMFRHMDRGDIMGVEGTVFKTKAGEVTIRVKKLELLAKCIESLPDTWFGMKDVEQRYRRRYLDLILNPETRKVFQIRSEIMRLSRRFMDEHGFVEVETPLLQSVYGGAFANPFKTHCDALDTDFYLAIAPELPLKKAMIGGIERVYEVTKKFRNEGVDKTHNPEHMTIEWYQAYADYNEGMTLFEDFIKYVAKNIFGKLTFEYQGNKIDLRKWQRIPLLDAIKEYLGEDISEVSIDVEAKKIAKKHGIDPSGITAINLADELMKLFRDQLIQPTFVIDYPIGLAPLSKPKRGDPTKAEIFQPFIGGMELGRAYSELNDPDLQAEHFEEQEGERDKGNAEAMPTDSDFVRALECGMPPACGVGIGMERLVMLFTNQRTIRDVIMFPALRPEDLAKSTVKQASFEKEIVSSPLKRGEALVLVKKYNKEKSNLNHYLESEAIMRALAHRFGEDVETWGQLGLLHDIDWELSKNNPKEHCIKAIQLLKNAGFSESFIKVIQSHAYGEGWKGSEYYGSDDLRNKKRATRLEHILAAAETLTGLIHAYALMKGSVSSIEVQGLKKKFKDKTFASKINREIIKECEQTGLSLDEFFGISIEAVKKIAKEVGLASS